MLPNDPTQSNPPYLNNRSRHNKTITDPRRKKVALIGFEEANQKTAPLDDPEWEVWGFNMGNRMGIHADSEGRFRADRWFDLHPIEPQSQLDMAWIHACPMTLYLPSVFTENPHAVRYPIEAVERFFGCTYNVPPGYWCSSFAYAIALAMQEGIETIGLFGVNLDWGRERIVERGNLEFWIGLALGMGITIIRSPGSKLLTHPARYGLEYEAERQAVILNCAGHVRQLLQQPEFKVAIEAELQVRYEALIQVRDTVFQTIQRLIYAPAHAVKLQTAEQVNQAETQPE